MQIVIDIGENLYTRLFDMSANTMRDMRAACSTIRNGTPLPKGHWILKETGIKITSYYCSECGRYVKDDTGYDVSKDYPFCHCGADMREVET